MSSRRLKRSLAGQLGEGLALRVLVRSSRRFVGAELPDGAGKRLEFVLDDVGDQVVVNAEVLVHHDVS